VTGVKAAFKRKIDRRSISPASRRGVTPALGTLRDDSVCAPRALDLRAKIGLGTIPGKIISTSSRWAMASGDGDADRSNRVPSAATTVR